MRLLCQSMFTILSTLHIVKLSHKLLLIYIPMSVFPFNHEQYSNAHLEREKERKNDSGAHHNLSMFLLDLTV